MEEKTIGALSKFTGVSVHTIKYYEKMGLISSHRDEHSNYRSYDVRVCTDIYECMKYRNMDFSVKDTAVLLKEADEEMLDQMIRQRQKEIDEEIAKLQLLKAQVDQYYKDIKNLDACLGKWYIEQMPHIYLFKQTHNLHYEEDAPMEEGLFDSVNESSIYKSIVTFSKDYLNHSEADFSWGNGVLLEEENNELLEKGLLHIPKGRAFVCYVEATGLFTTNGELAEIIREKYHEYKDIFLSDAYAVRIKITHDEQQLNHEFFKVIIPL